MKKKEFDGAAANTGRMSKNKGMIRWASHPDDCLLRQNCIVVRLNELSVALVAAYVVSSYLPLPTNLIQNPVNCTLHVEMRDVGGFRHPIRGPRTSQAPVQRKVCQCQRIRLPLSALI
jgi:hypothetical protein